MKIDDLRDSTIERLLNGESDLLSESPLKIGKKKENSPRKDELIDEDFDLDNSEEMKMLIEEEQEIEASIKQISREKSNTVNGATVFDDIDDLVEEELRKNNGDLEADLDISSSLKNVKGYKQSKTVPTSAQVLKE
jgi:hypothetical protein